MERWVLVVKSLNEPYPNCEYGLNSFCANIELAHVIAIIAMIASSLYVFIIR